MKRLPILLLFLVLIKGFLFPINNSSKPYGINVHTASNEVLARVKNAGINWVRIDALWPDIEYRNDRYSWKEMDRVINYCDQNGLSMVVILSDTPAWANNNKGRNYPATNVNEWRSFIRTVVKRYKNKVGFWSIWNEPNNRTFFAKSKDVFMNQIFLPAAKVIRANHGAGKIVGPDCAHLTTPGQEWYFWMKYILERGRSYIDIVSHHIYKNEGPQYIYRTINEGVNYLPSIREIIAESKNEGKAFWITETGWHTDDFTEETQADNYLEMLQRRYNEGYPQKIFFYEIIDLSNAPPWGILRANLNPKQAYDIYRQYINGQLPMGRDPDPEVEDKTCYSENLQAANRDQISPDSLARLRGLKERLNLQSTVFARLVSWYYRLGKEMTVITAADAELNWLAVKIINQVSQDAGENPDDFLDQPLDPILVSCLKRVVERLRTKPLSPELSMLVDRAGPVLERMHSRSINDWLNIMAREGSLLEHFPSIPPFPLDKTSQLKYK